MALRIVKDDIRHVKADVIVDAAQANGKDARNFYQSSLRWAREMRCRSIAFPLLTADGEKEKAQVLQIAMEEFDRYLAENETCIYLAVPNPEDLVPTGGVLDGVDSYVAGRLASLNAPQATAPMAAAQDQALSGAARAKNSFTADLLALGKVSAPKKKAVEIDRERRTLAKRDLERRDHDMHAEEEACADACFEEEASSLDERVRHVADTWQESLLHWIDEKGFTDTQVYKRANVDRKLFSKIRSSRTYQPKKITAVSFALALELNLDETRDFLGRAGYALSPSSVFDLIVEYFIEQGVYDTYTINLALFKHDQPILGE